MLPGRRMLICKGFPLSIQARKSAGEDVQERSAAKQASGKAAELKSAGSPVQEAVLDGMRCSTHFSIEERESFNNRKVP